MQNPPSFLTPLFPYIAIRTEFLAKPRIFSATQGPTAAGATVAMGFVQGLLAGVLSRGQDPAPLLRAAGIAPTLLHQPGARVSLSAYSSLYRLVYRALEDEAFGLLSQPLRLGSFELLCRGLLGSMHLAEALNRSSRFLAVLLPDIALEVQRQGPWASLRLRETQQRARREDDPARVFAFEWLLRVVHGLSCWLAGRALPLESVSFPYPKPAHAADYTLIYTEHARFHPGPVLEARLPTSLLDLPIRRDETDLATFLNGAPEKLTTLYRRDRQMAPLVRETLRAAADAPPGQWLDLAEVARRAHVSERTLHRRLAEEHTSFRNLKEGLRRELALERLTRSRQPVARIAADLGYTDPSAFYRAFVAWTQLSPTAYRAMHS